MKRGTVVIIPLYQNELNRYEKLSIYNTIDKFSDIYDIFFICAEHFDINKFYEKNNFDNNHKLNYIYFSNKCFESIEGYNNMLLSAEFYEYFANDYKYMLIVQTDAYIFNRDDLIYFIDKQYNFVGAPIIFYNYFDCLPSFKRGFYYNGGLSLRNIKFCIDCVNDTNFIDKYISLNSYYDEDFIFSSYEQEFYNSPDFIEASKFSIDNQLSFYLPTISFKQPFGVHHFYNADDNGNIKLPILKKIKWLNIEEEEEDTNSSQIDARIE